VSEGASVLGAVEESRTVRLSFPAKPEYITLSRLALTGLARVRPFREDTLADLKLALTEATSNSVRHAYGDGEGHVEISFQLWPDRLVVEISDDGAGFEPSANERDRASEEELSEGGLGIAIIRSIADELEIGSGPSGGSRLRFTKLL
jgi:serine/threonine-protein kinase RsbW